ncbi:MAG: fimbrillin family protein [Alistipes sp.]|nr:fimbrillin family protein [Alistipes sp.]
MKRFSLFALAALLIGCTQNDSQIEQLADRMPIKISLEKSRANDTAFESGDQVGLYVVNYNGSTAGTLTSTENHISNACFTLSTDWRADEELYWRDASTKADFYAYYPYGNPTDVSAYPFSVKIDQSAEADYWASDFLWGKRSGVAPTKNAVTITTEHLLSNALVYIKAGEGYTAEELAAADVEVKICNIKNSATINLATGVATATGGVTEIIPWNTGAYYRAMIVPQTVSADTNLISISINGKEYSFATDITFTAGIQHKIEVTVSAPSNGLVVNFSIKEWSVDDNIYSGEATYNPDDTPMPANNEIWYTSTDGQIIEPYSGEENNYATPSFGANIMSNTYENGKGTIKFDGEITMVGDYAFFGCINLINITLPSGITSIGEFAFAGCENLDNFNIPENAIEIGKYALYDCISITGCIIIPNGVSKIGEGTFAYCSSLANIVLPNSITSIGWSAFVDCDNLSSITIPDSVAEIGGAFLEGCDKLTKVYCKPTTPPSGNECMFDENALGRKIYVPHSSVSVYKSTQYWSDYADSIEGYDF